MSKIEKLKNRLASCPADFGWSELVTLLTQLGFEEIQGSSSRVKFNHTKLNCLIQLHKPHSEKILKRYIIKEILTVLKSEKLL